MVALEQLKALVSRLRSEGISEEEIAQTLREMGVDDTTISSLLGSAPTEKEPEQMTTEAPTATSAEELLPPPAPESTSAVEEVRQTPSPEEDITKLMLHEHAEKLEKIEQKITAATVSPDDLAEIKEMLREIKKELREYKAYFSAIQKLLNEILQTDRSILVDLYERAKKSG